MLAKRVVFFLLLLSTIFLLWMGHVQSNFNSKIDDYVSLPHVGHSAPDFTLNRITDDGEIRLSDMLSNNSGTILYFWTSWCPFCGASIGAMEDAFLENGDQINFIGINVTNQDRVSQAEEFLASNNVTFLNLLDVNGQVSNMYFVPPVPATVFIGKDGTILHRKMGAISKTELEGIIQQMIGG